MGIRVHSTGLSLDRLKLVDAGVMRELGDLAVEEIVTRTEGGHDYQGHPFQGYSPAYAKRKQRYGKGLGTRTVNLRGIGPGLRMLDAIGVTAVGPRKVTIGFRTAEKATLAFYHVESGAGKARVIRDFFGLSLRFLDRAIATIKKSWR